MPQSLRTWRLPLALVLACVALLQAPAPVQSQELTVLLVRHAEKVDDSRDAALSEAGLRRAELLSDALAEAGVDAIFTTQYQRTVNTGAPLARRLGIEPVVVTTAGSGDSHAADVAARVRERATGTVLVVGHSNTVPAIIQALGGPAVEIADDEYFHLFVMRLTADGVSLIRARF